MKGSYTNGKKRTNATTEIRIDTLHGSVDNRPFYLSAYVRNLDNPYLEIDADAELDVAAVLGFYPIEQIQSAGGTAHLIINFAGDLSQPKETFIKNKLKAEGELTLIRFGLKMTDPKWPVFENLNGNLLFNRNDLAVSNLAGTVNESSFTFNGFFRNLGSIPFYR